MTMQGKFTNKAQEVLKRAQEAALKLGNKYVGTEHILLGLTLVSDSVAAKALESELNLPCLISSFQSLVVTNISLLSTTLIRMPSPTLFSLP